MDVLEDGPDHPRNNPFENIIIDIRPLHRMRFPGRGLPVCKDRPIESLKHALNDRFSSKLVDVFLRRGQIKDTV